MASPSPTRMRNSVNAMWTNMLPFRSIVPTARPTVSTEGVIADGRKPLCAKASHAAAASPNDTTMLSIARRVPAVIASSCPSARR